MSNVFIDSEKPQKRAVRTSRAAKACDICRKQKTRCFPSGSSRSCLRCVTLGFECSFLTQDPDGPPDFAMAPLNHQHSTGLFSSGTGSSVAGSSSAMGTTNSTPGMLEKRLGSLEHNLSELVAIMKSGSTGAGAMKSWPQALPSRSSPGASTNDLLIFQSLDSLDAFPANSFGVPTTSFETSPFNSLALVMDSKHYPPPLERLKTPQMVFIQQNIITMGYITREQAIEILDVFLKYYNQWVSFHTGIPTEKLLDLMIQRSSLLLTVCCCVVIRYHYPELKAFLWTKLLRKLQNDLKETMLIVPHTIEFIQALAVMSIYASSLSDEHTFIVDAWFISGVALQHLTTRNVLGFVMSFDGGLSPVSEIDEITAYRVWNHLCLVHLVNCVMTGRVCNLDHARLEQCRKTLDISTSTNFDGRMVAEINFQLIVYLFLQTNSSLHEVEEKLRLWHDNWGYLFEQPTTQFVETGYHYGYFLVLYHWNYRQMVTAAGNPDDLFPPPSIELTDVSTVFDFCDNTHLRRMIRHSIKVIEGLLVVQDVAYFKALSDQIHFCGAYAAIMLAKLLESVKKAKRILDVSATLLTKCYEMIKALSELFNSVSTSPQDVTKRYADSILDAFASCMQIPPAV